MLSSIAARVTVIIKEDASFHIYDKCLKKRILIKVELPRFSLRARIYFCAWCVGKLSLVGW